MPRSLMPRTWNSILSGGGDVSEVSNLPDTTANATSTNAAAALIEEMKRAQEARAGKETNSR